MQNKFHLIARSLKYYRRPVFYQLLIIILLSAVITGSFLVGSSVKQSLKQTSSERLGNTGILISSGTRYFLPDLSERLHDSASLNCTGILEISGYCQSLNSQKGAFNIHIYGINYDFFAFQGKKNIALNPGEVAVNKRLSDYLGLAVGDELIIRFSELSDIPRDAPFAPSGQPAKSVVLKVGRVLDPVESGNFSISISQISPMNIFVNLNDISDENEGAQKINRILIDRDKKISIASVSEQLKSYLKYSDIGLHLKSIKKTGEFEISSNRIFIDEEVIKSIKKQLPGSAPVLTYLGNRFVDGSRSTPFSFISALPESLYPGIDDGIVINRWMADDLDATVGDSLHVYWYSIDSLNKMVEQNSRFFVKRIVDIDGIWSDSLLMPDFPGIAGKESCSDWDAGLPVKMHDIRPKDEDYWNKYRGTPKAFISYQTGKKLWGNNFGPATAIRFPAGLSEQEINGKLNGSFDPYTIGFTIKDLTDESAKAANQSVDFGTLFLSLGFFLILAAVILLSFASSSYFDSKKGQVRTLYAMGFRNRWITGLFLSESAIISFAGCITGAFAGYGINIILTKALNTIWSGAVQTNTLNPYFNLSPIAIGFALTFIVIMVLLFAKTKRYLKMLNTSKVSANKLPSVRLNIIVLAVLSVLTVSSLLIYFFTSDKLVFSFLSGTLMLLMLVFAWKQYYLGKLKLAKDQITRKRLSGKYYAVNPSSATSPILFIAAGIFIVFILGSNRKNFSGINNERSGGTGGYILWCENTIPVKEDLNSTEGRKLYGLDDSDLDAISFIQIKRSAGNDASCLNLNHISAPPLLGIDVTEFVRKKSFSFSSVLNTKTISNPWNFLNLTPGNNIIYGIADQSVLEWNLKLKIGDTLILRAENGTPLKIVIAGGLQSSVFQGNVIIGLNNFSRYFPSVSGSSVLLADGKSDQTDLYIKTLNDRLENNGVIIETTGHRLESFFEVTNTYLSVFAVLGALGMIIGIAGLGFVLLRNYNQRRQEFSLMLAIGFSLDRIRNMIFSEQLLIMMAGISTGIISAMVATLPSISTLADIPWLLLFMMITAIFLAGISALFFALKPITKNSLISSLKKE